MTSSTASGSITCPLVASAPWRLARGPGDRPQPCSLTARIGLAEGIVTTKTLRRRLFALAGRLTRSARQLTLHLPGALALGRQLHRRPRPAGGRSRSRPDAARPRRPLHCLAPASLRAPPHRRLLLSARPDSNRSHPAAPPTAPHPPKRPFRASTARATQTVGGFGLRVEPVEFAGVVETVLRSFEGQTEMRTFECSGDLPTVVRGDRNKLVEVLGNLVDNAVKYSPGGSSVRIACEVRPGAAARARQRRGLGIPEDELENISSASRASRTSRRRTFAAQGFRALSRARACRAHGRHHQRAERARRGQHVSRLVPPVSRAAATGGGRMTGRSGARRRRRGRCAPRGAGRRRRARDRELVRSVLSRRRRIRVVTASDGEEAVELARAHRPPLVLLDVRMPRMNGIDACRAMRDDPASAARPSSWLTAMGQDDDIARGYEAAPTTTSSSPSSPPSCSSARHEALGLTAASARLGSQQ